MKKTNLLAILALAATPAFLHAQTTNYSDVVGYQTHVAKGRGSSGSSQFFSLIPVQLQKPAVYAGTATASGTTVTLDGASLTANSLGTVGSYPTHYLQITSGSDSGLTTDIVSNTTGSIVTSDNFSSRITSGVTVKVLPHVKVTDVLGSSGSQKVQAGANISAADVIYLVNTNGAFTSFYYKTAPSSGLKNSSNQDASGLVVYPGEVLLIGRKQIGDSADIVQTGTVQNSDAKAPLTQGYNTVASGWPTTLVLSNLTSFVTQGGNISAADNVFVVDSTTGQLRSFYYKTAPGAGWKNSSNQNADANTDLSNGFVILRRSATPINFAQTKSW
jgi:hypothetical protein